MANFDSNKLYYRDNPNLRRNGIDNWEYEQWQKDEIKKCIADPIYFIKNYMKIINLDEGLVLFDMHDYQEEMVQAFHNNRFSIVRIGRQSGKCSRFDTVISIRNKKTKEIRTTTIGEFYYEQLQKRVNGYLRDNPAAIEQI